MGNKILVVSVIAVAMAGSPSLRAQSPMQKPKPVSTPASLSGGMRTSGTIESVNPAGNAIVVRADSGVVESHSLSPSAVITDGNSALGITDLKPGDSVTIVESAPGEVSEVRVAPVIKK